MKTRTLLSLFALLSLSLVSCVKDNVDVRNIVYTDDEYAAISTVLNLPNDRVSFEVSLPQHMKNLGMTPPAISDAKATLGRVLFYDKQLSRNLSVSCASCHQQDLAFADSKRFSEGFNGELTLRNSLALGSVANFKSSYEGGSTFNGQQQFFFWDERAHSIQEQSALTLQDNIEMGMDLNDLCQRLSEEEYYRVLFRKAYGTDVIQPALVTEALQEFVNAIVSTSTRFDEGISSVNGDPFRNFPNYTQAENMGRNLFVQHCSSCHGANMSISPEKVANNGLDEVYGDEGVGGITNQLEDIGKFKVPFLRNIALTAPYMHDGRFATLEEVVEHYNSGIKMSSNLDFRLRNGDGSAPLRLNLTQQEKDALVAFLNTLTDEALVIANRFSDPFK